MSRNCIACYRTIYPDALQKFRTRASSGNFVIYSSNDLGLCGWKFFFVFATHILNVVSDPILPRY